MKIDGSGLALISFARQSAEPLFHQFLIIKVNTTNNFIHKEKVEADSFKITKLHRWFISMRQPAYSIASTDQLSSKFLIPVIGACTLSISSNHLIYQTNSNPLYCLLKQSQPIFAQWVHFPHPRVCTAVLRVMTRQELTSS